MECVDKLSDVGSAIIRDWAVFSYIYFGCCIQFGQEKMIRINNRAVVEKGFPKRSNQEARAAAAAVNFPRSKATHTL